MEKTKKKTLGEWWSERTKNQKYLIAAGVVLLGAIIGLTDGKTTEQCKDDVRAYEFGREMQTWVELRSAGLSLQDAINEFSDGMGINPPYDANNECVKRGFDDASSGKGSPYNKDGKSWTTF